MIAIDTNILVYAHRADSPRFATASQRVSDLARRPERWAIPWPCLHEFYSVVTARKSFAEPTPAAMARQQIEAILGSPSLVLLTETERHWEVLDELIASAPITGIRIHDAKIAAICIQHGVRELWTADRDFSRFPRLKTVNPLAG